MREKTMLVARLTLLFSVWASSAASDPPQLDRNGFVSVPSGSEQTVTCAGSAELIWTLRRNHESDEITESEFTRIFGNVRIERRIDRIGPDRPNYLHRSYLKIKNITFDQMGFYRCSYRRERSRSASSNSLGIFIYFFVNDPKNILITEFVPASKVLYENATILCLPTDYNIEMTLWKGEERVVTYPDVVSFGIIAGFVFRKPTRYFDGIFSCRAKYGNSTQQISFRLISDRKKWNKTKTSAGTTMDVVAGSTLVLNCSGSFPPFWIVPRHPNGSFGKETVRHSRYMEDGDELYVNELRIENVQTSYTGLYRCCYESPECLSKEDESNVYVFVNDPKEPLMHLSEVPADDIARYRCIAQVVLCLPTFSDLNVTLWLADNLVAMDGNVSFDPKLGFVWSRPQKYPYLYTCKTQIGNRTQQLELPSRELDRKAEPLLYVYSSNLNPFEEESVEITCEACVYSFQKIWWTRTGVHGKGKELFTEDEQSGIEMMDESSPNILRRILRFRSVRTVDDGVYTCVGSTYDGRPNPTKSVTLKITPLQKPYFVHADVTEVRAIPGSRHDFHCRAEGIPPPSIIWYREGKRVMEDPPGVTFRQGYRILTIDPILEDDAGTFSCRAENSEGVVEARIVLHVQKGNGSFDFVRKTGKTTGEILATTAFALLLITFLSVLLFWLSDFRRKREQGMEEEQEEICISDVIEYEEEEDVS
ncbi:vascular endothelial growth factor receptor 1-like [Centruroides sculpturatus]|uniref:vascular endothelial growth factor receptor 1-like n=1 Tax=Centruroides sculpturatus TaxID=218467 RepID=UPI000C6D23B8|nr:vascular endothelial growth factor receptor 1-like [Centruroides sculpturatus]